MNKTIKRKIEDKISALLFKGKAIIIYGPRQTGKTTLIKSLIEKNQNLNPCYFNGDISDIKNLFSDINPERLKSILNNSKLIVIDEAQSIPNIGISLKIIVDELPDIQVIATGSSSFELADKTSEPLTGRKYEFHLFPFSYEERLNHYGWINENRLLYDRLVYGCYPEIITTEDNKMDLLRLLSGSYLYKDILMLDNLKKPALLEKILRALALQLGSEVNYNEIGQLVKADIKTVEKYIDLLCETFVLFKLPAMSRNIRNEITKGKKIYFWDNGVRNSIIGNFNLLENRTDVGALWENYIISERLKFLNYNNIYNKSYFWRTTQQQEIDYIEENESGDKLYAWEFKWNKNKKIKFSKTFLSGYSNIIISTETVSQENYNNFIS
ncbi:MAG TPA: ATP-binding protein [Victivallales bacterium]|nr:ATP-binding protein [Victivallales bacterium]|tara:strand:- start:61 stop:1209 length:1149 start_codon:yes stop_codon:yes gene_type:complete